jgi:hypothetical protein
MTRYPEDLGAAPTPTPVGCRRAIQEDRVAERPGDTIMYSSTRGVMIAGFNHRWLSIIFSRKAMGYVFSGIIRESFGDVEPRASICLRNGDPDPRRESSH